MLEGNTAQSTIVGEDEFDPVRGAMKRAEFSNTENYIEYESRERARENKQARAKTRRSESKLTWSTPRRVLAEHSTYEAAFSLTASRLPISRLT